MRPPAQLPPPGLFELRVPVPGFWLFGFRPPKPVFGLFGVRVPWPFSELFGLRVPVTVFCPFGLRPPKPVFGPAGVPVPVPVVVGPCVAVPPVVGPCVANPPVAGPVVVGVVGVRVPKPVDGPDVLRPPGLAAGLVAGVEGRDIGVDGCDAGLEKVVDGVDAGLDSGAVGLDIGADGLDTGAEGVAAGLETGAGAACLGAGAAGLAPGWLGCLSLSSLAFARLPIPRSPAIRRAKEPFRMALQKSEVVIVSSFLFTWSSSPALLPDAWVPVQSQWPEGERHRLGKKDYTGFPVCQAKHLLLKTLSVCRSFVLSGSIFWGISETDGEEPVPYCVCLCSSPYKPNRADR